jgi:hypothetical protein
MDASWVAAIAAVVSVVIVAVAAIAALLQIRHIRNANEITVYLRLVERLDSLQTRAAFEGMRPLMTRLASDPELHARVASAEQVPEFEEIVQLVRFLDNLTMLILEGGVAERLILAEYADDIVRLWDNVREVIQMRRGALGVHFGAAYEHLAMRAKAYRASGKMDLFYDRLLRDPRLSKD